MSYEITTCRVEAIPTAVIRGEVRNEDLARFVPAACGDVWSFIRSTSLPRPGRHVALYLGDGSVEVGAEIAESFVGNGTVHCSRLPAGRAATTTHYGPYAQLSKAHAALREWCAKEGHRPSRVSWEIYGHWEESWNVNPSQIRTDVFCLLEG